MSDQTQDKLWTDDAIYAWADKLSKYTVLHQCRVIETVHSGDVEALAEQIRDDYEQRLAAVVAERDQLRRRVAELEGEPTETEMKADNYIGTIDWKAPSGRTWKVDLHAGDDNE